MPPIRQSSTNLAISASTEGFTIGGGETTRSLTIKSGDITLAGGSTSSFDFPVVPSDTLVGEVAIQTLTGKIVTGSFFATSSFVGDGAEVELIAAVSWSASGSGAPSGAAPTGTIFLRY